MLLNNSDEDYDGGKDKDRDKHLEKDRDWEREREKEREKDHGVTLPSFTLDVDDDMDWEDNRLPPLHEWDEIGI